MIPPRSTIRVTTVLALGAMLACGSNNSTPSDSGGGSGVDAVASPRSVEGGSPDAAQPAEVGAGTETGLKADSEAPDDATTASETGSPTDSGNAIDAGTAADAGTNADSGAADSGTLADSGASMDGRALWLPGSATPIHFHWQLSTTFSYPSHVIAGQGPIVYDIDGENNSAATVAALHALGPNVKVVCYVDVGTYEPGRSDASQFPPSVLGAGVSGWPGERWFDVRTQSVLLPIMNGRIVNWCQKKGFDGVEPDNLDGWTNSPGFPMTEADSVSYDLAIATLVHSLGLSVGVKNLLPSLSAQSLSSVRNAFDWALSEQCFQYGECNIYQQSFAMNGKAAWDVEYNVMPNCPQAAAAHMNAQFRDLSLVAPGGNGYLYQPCVPDSQTTW